MKHRSWTKHPYFHAVTRCVSLSLGGFGLVNLCLLWMTRGFDGNLLWIDLRWMPSPIASLWLVASCSSMLAFAIWPSMPMQRKRVTLVLIGSLIVVAMGNAVNCMVLDVRGDVSLPALLPFSFMVACVLGLAFAGVAIGKNSDRQAIPKWKYATMQLAVLAMFAMGIPVSQMVWFGKSDYRRPADAVVVYGARAYADGSMSDALEDRVHTACELYEQGFVGKLIFSGGPGDGAIHESQAMQRFAIARGIPEADTLLDMQGLNTRATVKNTTTLFGDLGIRRVLAVSHDYHLPRIKMAYQQQGIEAYTVPAKQRYRLRAEPIYMAREIAAWWWYYLHPVMG